MEKKPLISVVTVSLNAEKTIERTIKSVLSQDFDNFEHVIVDGVSSDSTLNFIKKYSKKTKYPHKIDNWISEKDGGLYDAMNKAVKLASGKYVIFLNADDYFVNKKVLSNISKNISKMDVDLFCARVVFFERGVEKTGKHPDHVENISSYFKRGHLIAHQGLFAKRNLLLKYPFDLSYVVLADQDWMCRMLNLNKSFYISNRVVSHFSLNGLSRRNFILFLKEHLRFIKNNFGTIECLLYLLVIYPYRKLDNFIGVIGMMLKKNNPKFYYFLKKFV
jgi:glycosyltransferase involved in cell wall biosynthesis